MRGRRTRNVRKTSCQETRAPVELTLGAHRVRALGMRADLKAGTLRLESDVNGRFTP